jgi:cytochrome c-type biogenesis protein CcmH
MYMFWALAILMIAVSLWAIGRPLLRGVGTGPRAAEQDLQVYKDQLAEVERDLARGVLAADEAQSARIEVSRRILAADKRVQAQEAAKGAAPAVNRIGLALVVLVLAGGSLGLYALLGNPGLPDRPLKERLAEAQQRRAARMDQASAEALAPPVEVGEVPQEYRDLVEKLRTALADRPNDIQGLRLLALHESRLGSYVAARTAQEKLVGLLGDAATGEDYSALGEYLVFAAGGYVSPQAEEALVKALQLDPQDRRARYFSGLALAQNGRPDVAYQMWSGLLAEGPEDAPWIAPIRSQIDALAQAAGIDPATVPPRRLGAGSRNRSGNRTAGAFRRRYRHRRRNDAGRAPADDPRHGCGTGRAACNARRHTGRMGAADPGLWRAGRSGQGGADLGRGQADLCR